MSNIKCLMCISCYKFNGQEIHEILEKHNYRNFCENLLPRYCINVDNGKIIDGSFYYLQYVNDENDIFILFDIDYVDPLLEHEISDCGIDIINNIDYNVIFNNFHISKFSKTELKMPIKIFYDLNYSMYEDESKLDVKYIGHLNENLIIKKFNHKVYEGNKIIKNLNIINKNDFTEDQLIKKANELYEIGDLCEDLSGNLEIFATNGIGQIYNRRFYFDDIENKFYYNGDDEDVICIYNNGIWALKK